MPVDGYGISVWCVLSDGLVENWPMLDLGADKNVRFYSFSYFI